MAMADVTVRGAGIFGLSVAHACAARGARVRVIDPAGPGGGASGGLVGALAPHVPENWNPKKAFQLHSLLIAEDFWSEVAATGGRDPGYARTGRLQPVADDAALELARARARSAADLWQGQADWRLLRSEEAGTGLIPLSPSGWLILDTLSARLHPRKACAALAAAITARGGQIVTDGPEEGRVLHATGVADLTRIAAARGPSAAAGVKGQAALLQADFGQAPQVFAAGVHVVPHGDGTVAIGSTSERSFDDPDTTDEQLDAVIALARAHVPALAEAPVIARWAGLRPRAPSRAPILGAHPLHPGHFIANGGFKIGFGMAPGVAQVMADLMLDGRDAIPEGFRAPPL